MFLQLCCDSSWNTSLYQPFTWSRSLVVFTFFLCPYVLLDLLFIYSFSSSLPPYAASPSHMAVTAPPHPHAPTTTPTHRCFSPPACPAVWYQGRSRSWMKERWSTAAMMSTRPTATRWVWCYGIWFAFHSGCTAEGHKRRASLRRHYTGMTWWQRTLTLYLVFMVERAALFHRVTIADHLHMWVCTGFRARCLDLAVDKLKTPHLLSKLPTHKATLYYCSFAAAAWSHKHPLIFSKLRIYFCLYLPLCLSGPFPSEVFPTDVCRVHTQGCERPAESSTRDLAQQPDVTVRDVAGKGEEDVERRGHGHGPLSANSSEIQELQGEEWRSLRRCDQGGQVRFVFTN